MATPLAPQNTPHPALSPLRGARERRNSFIGARERRNSFIGERGRKSGGDILHSEIMPDFLILKEVKSPS